MRNLRILLIIFITTFTSLEVQSQDLIQEYARRFVVLTQGTAPQTSLILNGTFNDASNITLDNGWSILNGVLFFTDGFDNADATFTTSENITVGDYDLNFDIVTGGTNRFSIYINDVLMVPTTTYPTTLNQTISFNYSGTAIASITIKGSNAGGGTAFELDNITLKRTTTDLVAVTSVSIAPKTADVEVNGTVQLTATVLPVDATNKSGVWSSNSANATVDQNGLVTAVTEGSATITFTTNDGAFTDTCISTIIAEALVSATSVSITPETSSIQIGSTRQLTATFTPTNTSDKTGVWSSNSANATVSSSGLVTAVTEGSATITFTSTDGSFTDTTAITVTSAVAQVLKAFPYAYGGGSNASGGRGGNVYHVINLSDPSKTIDGSTYPDTDHVDYPGSFRWALSQPRPATIVFDVSGILVIQNWLDWSGTDLTIAGQSAPVGGFTVSSVAGNRFRIRSNGTTDNLIMRYIRVRPVSETGDDAFEPFEDNTITNVIFDHLSVSYGGDEGFSMRVNPGGLINNITFQRSILAENKTGSLYGTSWDNTVAGQATITSANMSWNNNLSFNNSHRSPNITSNGRFDYINNIVHNWEDSVGAMYGNIQGNILNNYFSLGERGTFSGPPIATYSQHNGWSLDDEQDNLGGFFTPSLYINGNFVDKLIPSDDDYAVNTDNWNMVWQWKNASGPNDYRVEQSNIAFRNLTPPTQIGHAFTVQSAVDAYNDVRTNSGANASLNADGSVTYYTDVPDTEYLATIATEGDFIHYNQYDQFKPYDYNPTFPTYKASVVAVDGISAPINTRPVDYYISNPHIPEVWFLANVPAGQDHNDTNAIGYTWLEVYLNQVDN